MGFLQPIRVAEAFDLVGMDLIGPLPVTKKGNSYIMLFSEYKTKWIEAAAIPDATARTCAQAFISNILVRHGAPLRILTDLGSNFTSQLFRTVNEMLGIKTSSTTAYHPQTNSLTEKGNGTYQDMIATYLDLNRDDWDEYLPYVSMAYLSSLHPSIGQEPFRMLYARSPRFPIDVNFSLDPISISDQNAKEYLNDLGKKLEFLRATASLQQERAHDKNKRLYDRNRRPGEFENGDKVWIYWPNSTEGSKLTRNWSGPYQIVRKISSLVYKVTAVDGDQSKVITINIDRMKKWYDSAERVPEMEQSFPDESQQSEDRNNLPKVSTGDEEEWEISKILRHRKCGNQTEYKIRWKGFRAADDSWVLEADLNAPDALLHYWKNYASNLETKN